MKFNDIDAAERWLLSLKPAGIRLGLSRVREVLARLGDPHLELAAVTIAGTNGKGSTAQFVTAMAHAGGYRVGLYTSPHLVSVTERIKVVQTPIGARDFARLASVVHAAAAGQGDGAVTREPVALTYFEVLTVMALLYFVEREVDLAVLEVGLGGRLDATAVVPPLVAILTNVGLDHERFLGNSVDAIAREKVEIVQPGSTLVSHVSPTLFRDVVGPHAFSMRAPIRRAGVDFVHQWVGGGFRYRGWLHRVGPVALGIRGHHQGDNAALACAAIESLNAHGFTVKATQMADGLERARHPGRLELRLASAADGACATLIDGAHNPLGAKALASQVEEFLPQRPCVMLFAANEEKDLDGMLRELGPVVDAIVVCGSSARPVADPAAVMRIVSRYCPHSTFIADPVDGYRTAQRLAGAHGGVLVTGSLYMIGELVAELPAAGSDQGRHGPNG